MRTLKLKNNMYWDSTSIIHNKKKLSDKLNNLVKNTKTNSDNDTYSCNYINDTINGTLLWQNNNIADGFQAQTLNIDLSLYNIIEIVYYKYPSTVTPLWRNFYKVGETTLLDYSDYDSNIVRTWNRQIQFTANSVIIDHNTINGVIDDKGMVPYQIIGHK